MAKVAIQQTHHTSGRSSTQTTAVLTPEHRATLIHRATEALKTLTPDALKKDPGLAFESGAINAFVALKSEAPAEWARWRAKLKKAGISLRDLDRRMQPVRAELQVVPGGTKVPRTVSSMLGAGCPVPDQVVPEPYSVSPQATAQIDHDGEDAHQTTIAFAPVLITSRLRDTDNGSESLELSWHRNGDWHSVIRDRGTVMDPRKLISLASNGFPVAGDNAAKLSAYLHKFEALNHQTLPFRRTSSHLGWQGTDGKDGFLWGRTLIGADGRDPHSIQFLGRADGDEQLAGGYTARGTFDAWRDGIQPVSAHRRALVILYAAFVPPLLHILRVPNFALDLCGSTSVGKTTNLRLAASVWGCPDEAQPHSAIHTWDLTPVWAERASAVLSDVPLILDDTKRARFPETIETIVYTVASGHGRGRGNVESLATTRTWQTVLLSSGEAPATSYSQAGGTRTRCLEIRGLPFDAQDQQTGSLIRGLNSVIRENYGHAGPIFVKHLVKQRPRMDHLRLQYGTEINRFSSTLAGVPEADRLAQPFAAMAVAVRLAHEALSLPWKTETGLAALDQVWPEVVSEATDAVGAKRALREVMGWAHANESSFHARCPTTVGNSSWSGHWPNGDNWTSIAFYEHKLKKVLSDLRYLPEAILFEWKSRGWLDTRQDRKKGYTKQVSVGGNKQYMVVIRRQYIDQIEEE